MLYDVLDMVYLVVGEKNYEFILFVNIYYNR